VDVLDVEGRLIDFKTASRRPSCVSPDYAFQLATYRQITPGASGEVRIDSLVKTQTVQIVQQAYTVEEAGHPGHPGPVSDGAEGHGIRDVLSQPAVACSAARSIAASGSSAKQSSAAGSGNPDLRHYAVNAKRPAQDAIAAPWAGRLSSN
jgi:hypothetical protein